MENKAHIYEMNEQHGIDTRHSLHPTSAWGLRSRCVDKSICHVYKMCDTNRTNQPDQPTDHKTHNTFDRSHMPEVHHVDS